MDLLWRENKKPMDKKPIVKIEIFIPGEFLGKLSEALYQAGAGRIGQYDHCLSYSEVMGQWRPLEEAKPFSGTIGEVTNGRELKVEVNCAWEIVTLVMEAVRKVHPYEEPVINVIPLINHLFK